uniref:Uncharacterized protein n=1 Tax=Aegilops tauschii subsp. strangulata TaxID=200361 RepID=A0A453QI01_AEGTS
SCARGSPKRQEIFKKLGLFQVCSIVIYVVAKPVHLHGLVACDMCHIVFAGALYRGS